MATKQYKGQASFQQRPGRPSQDKKGGKQPETAASTYCASDLEQQESSNKGKGPAGENL